MKSTILILSIHLIFFGRLKAQTTYDVFTCTLPKGYKQEIKTGFTSYTKTDNKTGTYCIISLYKQSPSSGDLIQDFDNDWKDLVTTALNVTAVPQKDKGDEISGWQTYSGGTNFEFSGSTSMALLTTAKKDNANVAILIVSNSNEMITKDVDAFYATLKLGKPQQATSNQTTTTNNNSNNAKPTSVIGEWSNTGAILANYVNSSGQYVGDASTATTVSFKFLANGNYEEFFASTSGYKTHTFYYKGSYKINGNFITVTPAFYEHKLNTKLQPDNDPKNKKPKTFSYKFEFITSQNNWGLQFTGDDNNFMLSNFMYKVGEAITTNNVVAPNTNSTSSSTNKLLSDNGIAGVWVSYANLSAGLGSLTWNWVVFFNNRKSLSNIPNGGFANLANDEYFDKSKNDANYFNIGSYSFANGKGSNVKAGAKYDDKLVLEKPNQLKIDNTVFMKCSNVNGQKLNGSFTSYANPSDPQLNTLAYGEKPVITFSKDGKFNDEGLFNTYLFDGATNPAAAKPGNGTYELKDYSIILKYNDGRVRQEAFTIPFSNNTNDATIIFISRAQINKIK